MIRICLAFALALLAIGLGAEEAEMLVLDGLKVPVKQLQLTEKPGYVYALLDLFPFRDQVKGDAARLERLAKALANGMVAERYPAAAAVKVALVEFPENDNYGAPMWSKVVVLARYYGERSGKGFKLLPDKGKDAKAGKSKKPAKAKAPAAAPAKP